MGISTQYVSVDITKKTAPQIIRLGQGDKNGTTIAARIYNDGAEYSMSGKTARFCMRTPDGKASYSVNSSSTSGNVVSFNINEQYAASVAGKTDVAYIEVLSGSTVICSTSRISVVVYRSASEGLPVAGAYSDALSEAISSAQSAASTANSAASNANTKATRADNAATSANNATQSANTAKDAANAAASAATTAAGSATTAAEAANSAKDAANAAATAANTAAGSANAATSEANAAIEAMGDISELAVPEMTASVRGGAKVGGSTQVIGGKLEVKLSENATGTSVTTGSTSALRELQVHGKSVQDGTPTPDAPVPVQVVEGANVWHESALEVGIPRTSVGITWVKNADGTYTANGTATANSWTYAGTVQTITDMAIPLNPGIYTASTNAQRCALRKVSDGEISTLSNVFSSFTFTAEEGDSFFICPQVPSGVEVTNETYYVQIVPGSVAVPYTPYGSIALDIKGRNLTPFFSIPMDDTTYWQNETTPYTSNELGRVGFQGDDGWAHYDFDNSGKTASAYVNIRCKYSWHNAGSFMPNETYTIITEIKGLTGSGLVIRPVRPDQNTSIFVDSNMQNIGSDGTYSWTVQTKSDISQMEFVTNGLMRVSAGKACSFDIRLSIVKGSVVLPYAPYPTSPCLIDLQGNVLASLPDGTCDELHVDSAGHVVIDKRVGVFDLGELSWTYNSNNRTIFFSQALPEMKSMNTPYVVCECYSTSSQVAIDFITAQTYLSDGQISGRYIEDGSNYLYVKDLRYTDAPAMKAAVAGYKTYYPLATPQTIDLGYIDPPAIPSGSVVTVSASLTPTFDLSCWTEHASELADMPDARIPEFGDGLALDGDTLSVDLETADGVLLVANGGTGLTASPSALVDLASSAAASMMQASPRPGVTGTLPVAHGGTGATTAAAALTALGAAAASDMAVYEESSPWASIKFPSLGVRIAWANTVIQSATVTIVSQAYGGYRSDPYDVAIPSGWFTSAPSGSIFKNGSQAWRVNGGTMTTTKITSIYLASGAEESAKDFPLSIILVGKC